MRRHQAGVTLLEIILVLVIAGSILVFSIQQYFSFKYNANVVQVQANVNEIFQAMSAYYRANCYGTTDPTTGVVTYGSLNPNSSPGNTKVLDINTDLIANGFLTATINPNPIVQSSGTGKGYAVQFNRTDSTRTICKDAACTSTYPIGTIVTWKAQVAVQLNSSFTTPEATAYLNLLQGDCLSTGSGTAVTACTTGSTGKYVVWERLPSSPNTEALSNYWVTTPTVRQFTQMYTTNPMSMLTNGTSTTTQYFVCGN